MMCSILKSLRLATSAWLLVAQFATAAPGVDISTLGERQSANRLVFCHFMIGIVGDRNTPADYDNDMQRAKSLGIDAFALNIGVDGYTDQQLGLAYQSAANNGMKVFISFDFNWYHTSDASAVGSKIAQYASQPAQLMVDGKVFASSFAGDGVDVTALRAAAGVPIFWAPNFHPSYGTDFGTVDGALNWLAWDNNGNNKAPTPGHNVTVEMGDADYIKALAGKPYIAPVSAWFSTHFGPEVPYSKNWIFPSDLLWFRRWTEILTMGPRFLEIITWNDYGESHYIGPLSSKHYDDGNSKWVNDMPHDGWLDMAKPYIAAFHAGATSVTPYITSDQLIYWYRPTLRSINCDATDTTMVPANNASGNYFMGRPDGSQDMADSIFVVALLTAPGTVTITSGGNTHTFSAPAGATSFQVDMAVGPQSFALSRSGQTVFTGTSLRDVSSICPCGIYNFNAYVGTLPPGFSDPLGHDGLVSLTVGLHVSTCSATPSLGTNPPNTSPSMSTTLGSSSSASMTTTAPPMTTTTGMSTTTPKNTTPPVTTPSTTTTQAPSTTMKTSNAPSSSVLGCYRTITASSQIFPTNCLQKGDIWAGPTGQGVPDRCDGPVKCTWP